MAEMRYMLLTLICTECRHVWVVILPGYVGMLTWCPRCRKHVGFHEYGNEEVV